MTIKTIYKVEGDSNEYDSEQEAQIAECIENADGIYVDARHKLRIAKAISEKYFLVPIVKTETVVVTEEEDKEPEAEDLDRYDQKDPSLP